MSNFKLDFEKFNTYILTNYTRKNWYSNVYNSLIHHVRIRVTNHVNTLLEARFTKYNIKIYKEQKNNYILK